MSTYGGGINANFVSGFANHTLGAGTTVVYTCPADKYVWFRPLSLLMVSGIVYSGNLLFRIEVDDGGGGFTPVFDDSSFAPDPASPGTSQAIKVTGKPLQDPQGFFLLVPGSRFTVRLGNNTGVVRLSYSAVEFSSSS
jgi:hypothetical protein